METVRIDDVVSTLLRECRRHVANEDGLKARTVFVALVRVVFFYAPSDALLREIFAFPEIVPECARDLFLIEASATPDEVANIRCTISALDTARDDLSKVSRPFDPLPPILS